ncbi:MAG: poly-beta-1,6 N-acetyl-D-glucosamine synthase [Gemmatimonadetes bacterium]|nr:poly-beta-1,6 N-acetyl-D-glucosamine synthase [Gemmatimonadota bacterium]
MTADIVSFLEWLEHTRFYLVWLVFFAWYPMLTGLMWIVTSLTYWFRRERNAPPPPALPENPPFVTVLMPAYCEGRHLADSLEAALAIDYPAFEVLVIDDASDDETPRILAPYVASGRVRVVRKTRNEGKAMALNDGLLCARGDILLIVDADAHPAPDILRHLVPHFESPRVGAVTGNPRVRNRRRLLARLQAIEFTSIVSLQKRAQRVWGRILTVSGVVGAFHRDALLDVGLFSPDMATEDIDISWKLQLRAWDIRYEPRALVWMQVPERWADLWKQRRRWSLGLAQVLRRHVREALRWRSRRFWPVVLESSFSIAWGYSFVLLTALWILSYAVGYPPIGGSPIPNWWGMLMATVCLGQLLTGVLLDRRYDERLGRSYVMAIIYPLIYWMFLAIVTVRSTPRGFFRSPTRKGTQWKTRRD